MEKTQFRKASWGMSKEQVRATEESPAVYEKDNALGYNGEIMETPCMVYFEFENGELTRGAYLIDNTDDDRDIEDYNHLKLLLTKKYGEPNKDAMVVTPKVYRLPKIDSTVDLEKALSEDAVRLKTWWQTEDTYVSLACRGLEGNVQLAVMYNSLESRNRADEASEARDLERL